MSLPRQQGDALVLNVEKLLYPHERLCIPTKRIAHEHGQLVVTVTAARQTGAQVSRGRGPHVSSSIEDGPADVGDWP